MTSRDKILSAVKRNQPASVPLPEAENILQPFTNAAEKFETVLQVIGGQVFNAANETEIIMQLQSQFAGEKRIISVLPGMAPFAVFYDIEEDPHLLENVDVAIIPAQFAVAENGAVWVTDQVLPGRVLPFICQHLVVLVNREDIVDSLHVAYDVIGSSRYGFGTFIAGPSKTADIEQSLVLGAHGPKSMTVFLMA